MNLVDAIRKATQAQAQFGSSGIAPLAPPITTELPTFSTDPEVPPAEASAFVAMTESFQTNSTMNLVRMEFFLTPEQTHMLLRGTLSTHRAVMTSREVAAYLRLHQHTVEEMAASGELPGFRAEDSWRFLKSTVDEWLTQRADFRGEGNNHAA